MAIINGTPDSDQRVGTEGADEIFGGAGNDVLSGLGGDDALYGGDDADDIDGGAGDDTIYAGTGRNDVESSLDVLNGGAGNDTIFAGVGDIVAGGTGNDTIQLYYGLAQPSIAVEGGDDIDTFRILRSDDAIASYFHIALDEQRSLYPDAEIRLSNVEVVDLRFSFGATVYGGAQADTVIGSWQHADTFYGGRGDDRMFVEDGDFFDGELGQDTVDFSRAVNPDAGDVIAIDLNISGPQAWYWTDVFGTRAHVGQITLRNIENVVGSDNADWIAGTADANKFEGGKGADELSGRGGDDELHGGEGSDKLYGDAGDDQLFGDAGEDQLYGGADNDRLEGGAGDDTLRGETGDDTLVANSGADRLIGGAGADTLIGGSDGLAWADYSESQSSVRIDFLSVDGHSGDAAEDSFQNISRWHLTDFGDFAFGSEAAEHFHGGGGGDHLQGGGGDDVITGGDGTDGLYGQGGNDTLIAGFGDSVFGGEGDDIVELGATDVTHEYNVLEVDGGDQFDTLRLKSGDAGLVVSMNPSFHADADVHVTNVERVEIGDLSATVYGSSFADQVVSGAQADTIHAGAGNDTVSFERLGAMRNDILHGGEGQDTLDFSNMPSGGASGYTIDLRTTDQRYFGPLYTDGFQASSFENVTGSSGIDELQGNDAANRLDGRQGADTLHGHAGDDELLGGGGDDTLYGGNHSDKLYGEDGDDELYGESGNDQIDGGRGNDELHGGDGDDVIQAAEQQGNFVDHAYGGAGNDTLYGDGKDVLRGGGGADHIEGIGWNQVVASYSDATAAVQMDFRDPNYINHSGDAAGDTFVNIGGFELTSFADTFYGGEAADVVLGGKGDDLIDGGLGWDSLDGGDGNDTLHGEDGNDVIQGAAGDDTITGGDGNDVIYTGAGARDVAYGGGGNDVLYGADSYFGDGVDLLYGGDGDDILNGVDGNDHLDGGAGNDHLEGGYGNDTLIGGAGNDTLAVGGSSLILTESDHVDAGDGNDIIYSLQGTHTLIGGAGNDLYYNVAKGNTLVEAADGGVDTIFLLGFEMATFVLPEHFENVQAFGNTAGHITGNASDNDIRGTNYGDDLRGEAGNDVLRGGAGQDTLSGGEGNDVFFGDNDGEYVGQAWTQDSYEGGKGDDVFYADVGETIVELDGEGVDEVRTSAIEYTLGDNIENLTAITPGYFAAFNNHVLRGNALDNSITGGRGTDALHGNGGDDILAGGGGNDTIDGGDGTDSARFEGARADYQIVRLGDGSIWVRDLRNTSPGDGTDILTNIEKLAFSDGTYTTSQLLNSAPTAVDDVIEIDEFSGVNLWPLLLGNDTDPNSGDTFAISAVDTSATTGQLVFVPETGLLTYRPSASIPAGQTVTDSFTYTMTDGRGGVDTATVTITVRGILSDDDWTNGTSEGERIVGTDGDDLIRGLAGDDHLLGGAGADRLDGGADNDIIEGGEGHDTVSGGAGDDTLYGDEAPAALARAGFAAGPVDLAASAAATAASDDTLAGDAGADTLVGGAGDDMIDGGDDADTAVFSGARSDYAVELLDGGMLRVSDLRDGTPDGADTVANVETFTFADRSYTLEEVLRTNAAPTDIVLDGSSIVENAPVGTAVGTATGADPDGDLLDYSLVDDAGGRFVIDAATGVLAVAQSLDHETNASFDIVVRATDGDGAFVDRSFTIVVGDVNEAPTAEDDGPLAVAEGGISADLAGLLLANDHDADRGDSHTITSVSTAGTLGRVVFDPATQSLRYAADALAFDTLAAGATATDSFTYTIEDANGLASTASVTMTVIGINDAPVVADAAIAVAEDASSANLWDQLIGQASDVDLGDVLSIASVDTTGTKGSLLFDQATQTLRYVADADAFDLLATGAKATDSFTYTVTDQEGLTSTATITVEVTGTADGKILKGGNGKDTLVGTDGEDVITGNNGNDTLSGLGGADRIDGGNGNDVISGGHGIDTLNGGNGDDKLDGGAGGDVLNGGLGQDVITGGAGDDVITGLNGHDLLTGGAGADSFVFGIASDIDKILDFNSAEDSLSFVDGASVLFHDIRDTNGDGQADTVLVHDLGGVVILLGAQYAVGPSLEDYLGQFMSSDQIA